MLGKVSGNFGNFSLLGKVINVDFFSHFCPQKMDSLEISRYLKFFGILGILILLNNYMRLINVGEIFYFSHKKFWHSETIFMLQNIWAI